MRAIVLLTTILLLSTTITFAQKRTFYHTNTFDRTFTTCEKPPTFGRESLDLQNYLTDKLQNQIPETEGQIKIAVLIDSTGKPLCEWIDNNSNFKMNKNKLNLIIDSMPKWNAGIQNGRKVDCADIIELIFNKQNLGVTYRMGTK